MSRWSASLRLARRDAWRHKGRSALVVTMIGLPVAAIVFGGVAFRTLQLSPTQQVTTQIGTAADAWVSAPTGRRIAQSPPGSEQGIWTGARVQGAPPDVNELLPQATRVLETRYRYGALLAVTTDDRAATPSWRELDYTDPLAAGLIDQVSGRAPASTDEVVVTEALAGSLGVTAGDQVHIKGRSYEVVGVVRLPFGTDWEQVVGTLGAFSQLRFPTAQGADGAGTGWLVEQPGGLDYDEWQRLNRQGSMVISRAVAADPPDPCSSEVPAAIRMCDSGPMSPYERQQLAETAALVGLLVGMGVLQVVLLAGPAFAIGRRRQAHDLALVAAAGGDARSVRRVVLAGGVVLGLAGGLAGLAVGIAGFWLVRPLVSRLAGSQLFPTDVRPELLLAVGAAVATGLVAAWLPARQASRQDIVATLAGRRGVVRGPRWVPVAGAVALGVGIAIAFFGALPGEPALLLLGCVTAELGLVAMTPTIVGAISKAAPRLRTAPRLALRDAGRNRMRAGTAVAAVLAAVAGATALGVYVASDEANGARHYQPTTPLGYVALTTTTPRNTWPVPSPDLSPVAAELPTRDVVVMEGARQGCMFGRCGPWKLVPARPGGCSATSGCTNSFASRWAAWLTGDTVTYRALTGADADPEVTQALADGGVVLAGDSTQYLRDGHIEARNRRTGETVTLPAVAAPASEVGITARFEVLFSPAAFDQLGLERHAYGATITTTQPPTSAQLAAARHAMHGVVPHGQLDVGVPWEDQSGLAIRLLLLAAAVIAVAATATAVGLAAADGRADLATLAAVGAAPRTRRWLAASQAALIACLGTVLGVAGGLVVGVAAVNATPDRYLGTVAGAPTIPLEVPWPALLQVAVVIPAVTVVAAWLFTRSRLPMVQRLD